LTVAVPLGAVIRQTMMNDPTRLLPDNVVFQLVRLDVTAIPTTTTGFMVAVALRLPDVPTDP